MQKSSLLRNNNRRLRNPRRGVFPKSCQIRLGTPSATRNQKPSQKNPSSHTRDHPSPLSSRKTYLKFGPLRSLSLAAFQLFDGLHHFAPRIEQSSFGLLYPDFR